MRVALEVEGRRDMSRFSDSAGGVDGVAGAEAAKGLNEGLRAMVKRDPSVLILAVRWSNVASSTGVSRQQSCEKGSSSFLGRKRRC